MTVQSINPTTEQFITERTSYISEKIDKVLRVRDLARKDLPEIVLSISTNLNIVPEMQMRSGKALLTLPFLFLFKTQDLWEKKDFLKRLVTKVNFKDLTEHETKIIQAFSIYIRNPILSEKVKKFVLYHELGHLILGHFNKEPSLQHEIEADFFATIKSQDALEGGIYLFQLMSFFFPHNKTKTHPTYETRAEYLTMLSRTLQPFPLLIKN